VTHGSRNVATVTVTGRSINDDSSTRPVGTSTPRCGPQSHYGQRDLPQRRRRDSKVIGLVGTSPARWYRQSRPVRELRLRDRSFRAPHLRVANQTPGHDHDVRRSAENRDPQQSGAERALSVGGPLHHRFSTHERRRPVRRVSQFRLSVTPGCRVRECGRVDRFELSPSERFIMGTSLVDGVLVLRPTLARRIAVLPSILVVPPLGIMLLAGNSDSAPSVALALLATLALAVAAGYLIIGMLRSRVLANPTGLSVRDRWRTKEWTWVEVDGFGVEEQRATKGGLVSLLAWDPLEIVCTPVMTVQGRSLVRLWFLASETRERGLTLGGATAAEVRAGILARYHAAATSGTPTYVPAPPSG
jgi:hypothetical protein